MYTTGDLLNSPIMLVSLGPALDVSGPSAWDVSGPSDRVTTSIFGKCYTPPPIFWLVFISLTGNQKENSRWGSLWWIIAVQNSGGVSPWIEENDRDMGGIRRNSAGLNRDMVSMQTNGPSSRQKHGWENRKWFVYGTSDTDDIQVVRHKGNAFTSEL